MPLQQQVHNVHEFNMEPSMIDYDSDAKPARQPIQRTSWKVLDQRWRLQSMSILPCGFGIMDGAWTHNDQQTIILRTIRRGCRSNEVAVLPKHRWASDFEGFHLSREIHVRLECPS